MSYLTPNKVVKEEWCPISINTLRAMIHKGKVPGFWCGKTYYINIELFQTVLQEMSLATIKHGAPLDLAKYRRQDFQDETGVATEA